MGLSPGAKASSSMPRKESIQLLEEEEGVIGVW